ncbi:MAG TPA: dTMP kinase [Actinomycetota bacterium]
MGPLFLVVEGMDGAGKSTQIERLARWLTEAGSPPVVTREPGATAIGRRLREILLDPASAAMDPRTEALLYAADRAQHAAEVIRPALAAGRVVISDRYVDSSLAYQGLARGLGIERILDLSMWATGDLLPDLVILLDVAPELARARSGATDRIELEDEAFHRRVADAYWALARTYPERFAAVDASAPPDAIEAEIRHHVEARLVGQDRGREEVRKESRVPHGKVCEPLPATGSPAGRDAP